MDAELRDAGRLIETAPRATRATRSPPARHRRALEATAALVGSLACATAIFGAFVGAGGRYLDDWWLGVNIAFPRSLGFAGSYDYLTFYSGARPGAVAYWLGTYELFGFHDGWHRALSVALAGALAAACYLLLRELRLGRADAAAIALLTLALPVADAIHFWITPAVAQLCLTACLLGLLVAVRALRAPPSPRAIALHAASLALLGASLLMAETMLPAIALSLLVYRTQVSWRRAAARWSADLLLVGIATIHYAVSSPVRLTGADRSIGALAHARTIADELLTLFTSTIVPYAPGRAWVLGGLLAGAVLVGAELARRRRAGGDLAPIVRWLVVGAVAALTAAASYAIYVPAAASYTPLSPGVGNRVNIGALVPLAVLAYAVVRLIGGIVAHPRARTVVTAALLAAVLVPALLRLCADRTLWIAAAQQQETVLSAVQAALPTPPTGASLLVLNAPGVVTRFGRLGHASINQPVPVFSTWWELDAAVKLRLGRPDVAAYPIWADQPPQVLCGAHYVYQLGLDGVRHALPYGRVYVIDVHEPQAIRLDDATTCTQVTERRPTIRYDLAV
ncbi:MAG: hypothetical protein QOI73_2519 [Solirubrobacteraceae bacterium]|nr:hypothetical protein [Solirubrobacteraceae bacterium]